MTETLEHEVLGLGTASVAGFRGVGFRGLGFRDQCDAVQSLGFRLSNYRARNLQH